MTDLSLQGLRVAIAGPIPIGTGFWVHICYREASHALMTYYHSAVQIERAIARWSTPQETGLQIEHITLTNEQRLRQLLVKARRHNGEAPCEAMS